MSEKRYRACMFLADYGSDPSECGVPWWYLTSQKVQFDIATETGKVPDADHRMYKGVFSMLLGADKAAKRAYLDLAASTEFQHPRSFSDASFDILEYDLVILPGGHDKGVKQLFESQKLHEHLARYMPLTKGASNKKVLGAICHGPLALAFAKDAEGHSLLYDRKLTCLPEPFEKTAHTFTKFVVGDYYRTYPGKFCAGQVKDALASPEQFNEGPPNKSFSRAPEAAFVFQDERFITARWPGDAFLWSQRMHEALKSA